MILAGENVHSDIIKVLRGAGFDVICVIESSRGIKDEQVIQLALQNNYLLLTEDKDFGEWVFAHYVKDLSVLFLRYSFYEIQEIKQALIYFPQNHALQRPFFATITTKKIRVRQL